MFTAKTNESSLYNIDSLDTVLRGAFLYLTLLTSLKDDFLPMSVKKAFHGALTALVSLSLEEEPETGRYSLVNFGEEDFLFLGQNPLTRIEFNEIQDDLITSEEVLRQLVKTGKLSVFDDVIARKTLNFLRRVDMTCTKDYVMDPPSEADCDPQ